MNVLSHCYRVDIHKESERLKEGFKRHLQKTKTNSRLRREAKEFKYWITKPKWLKYMV